MRAELANLNHCAVHFKKAAPPPTCAGTILQLYGKRTILRQNFRLGYRIVLGLGYGLGLGLGLC